VNARDTVIEAAEQRVRETVGVIRDGETVSPGNVALWYADQGTRPIGPLPDGPERERAFSVLREMAKDRNADGVLIIYDTNTVHLDQPEEFFQRIGGQENVAKYSIDEVVQMGFGQKLEAIFCIAQMPRFAYRIKQPYERAEGEIVLRSPTSSVLSELRGSEVIFPDDPTELLLTTKHDDDNDPNRTPETDAG